MQAIGILHAIISPINEKITVEKDSVLYVVSISQNFVWIGKYSIE